MRSNALFRFDNTFDVYAGTYTQDPISFEFTGTFVLIKEGEHGLIVPGQQRTVYLSTKTLYPVRSQIRNVRDRNGVYIFGNTEGQVPMYIVEAQPQYDSYGSVVGYKHALNRVLPKDLSEKARIIAAAASGA